MKNAFYDHPNMYAAIIKFRVWNCPSNLTPKMKFNLEKLKNLPDQVKSLSENLTKFKSNQNSTYDMVHEINCRGV